MADDRIKLGIDASESVYQLDTLASKFDGVKVSAEAVADAYELVDAETAAFEAHARSLADWMDRLDESSQEVAGSYKVLADRSDEARYKAIPLTEATRTAAVAYELAADAADHLSQSSQVTASAAGVVVKKHAELQASTRNVGQAALTASYAMQDFAQGGIGGVLNNIPTLVQQLGGPAGLAAAIGGVGVAAYILKQPLTEFVGWITSGSIAIPKMRDALKDMDDELKTAKDRLKELGGGYGLTNEQLAEYKQLSAEVLTVERERNAEAERRLGIAKALKEEEDGKRSPEAAKAAKQAIEGMGGINDAANAARVAMEANSPELAAARANADAARKQNGAAAQNPLNPLAQLQALAAIRKAERERDAVSRRIEGQSQDLVLNARGGNQDAIGQLAGLLPNQGFENGTRETMAAEKKRQEEAAKSVKDRQEWEKAQADKAEADQKAKEVADKEKAQADKELAQAAKKEQDRKDAILDPLRKDQGRQQIDAAISEMERAANGGFTGAESQQLAAGNQTLMSADRGQASPDQLQKIIQQNDAMMRSLADAGGDGSGAMSAFMQQQQQLLWALGQIQQQKIESNQWRQMQPINGTLLSRGGG